MLIFKRRSRIADVTVGTLVFRGRSYSINEQPDTMNKRTKIELVIFAIVAIFFIYTQIRERDAANNGNDIVNSNIETELKSSNNENSITATDDTDLSKNG